MSLQEAAKTFGIPFEKVKELCRPDDPLLELAGVLESEIKDVSAKHDDYLGQQSS